MKREIAAWVMKDGDGWLCHDGEDWCWTVWEDQRVYFRSQDSAEMAYRRYKQANNRPHDELVTWKAVPVYAPKGEEQARMLDARIAHMRHVARIEPSAEKTMKDVAEALNCPMPRPKEERHLKFPSQAWW